MTAEHLNKHNRYVSTSASDCLERLVSEMIFYVLSGTLNSTHSFTHSDMTLYATVAAAAIAKVNAVVLHEDKFVIAA